MATDKCPTRGGELLAKKASHAEIAQAMGRDKSLVTRWITGERNPTKVQRAKLKKLYGVMAAAWDEPAPAQRSRATPPPPPPEDPDEGNTDRLRRFIREGMRELEFDTQLSGVKRAEALKKLVDAQVALDRSTGENAVTKQKILAHPEFRLLIRLLTEAVAPHPETLARVVAVLEANQ